MILSVKHIARYEPFSYQVEQLKNVVNLVDMAWQWMYTGGLTGSSLLLLMENIVSCEAGSNHNLSGLLCDSLVLIKFIIDVFSRGTRLNT